MAITLYCIEHGNSSGATVKNYLYSNVIHVDAYARARDAVTLEEGMVRIIYQLTSSGGSTILASQFGTLTLAQIQQIESSATDVLTLVGAEEAALRAAGLINGLQILEDL